MELSELNIIGRKTALFSYLIGTSFLLAYFTFSNIDWVNFWIGNIEVGYWIEERFLVAAMYYIGIAFCVNLAILIPVLVHTISNTNTESRNEYLQTALLMIANIPIAIVYFYMVICSI